MVTACDILSAAAAEAFAPKESLHVDEWAERYRVLPKKVSAQHGRWDNALTPYLKRPMRCFTHESVRHITEMFGSQLGKSESVDNMKMFTIDCDPVNALVMMGNLDEARNVNADRFIQSIRACPRVARHLLPSPQETKSLKINFDQMIMYFIGSNSKSGRRGKPLSRLFLDEVETYIDPQWEEVYERVKGGDGLYKVVDTSTPWMENAGIHKQFRAGSREQYFVPCPHCGLYQKLVFTGRNGRGLFGLVWDGGTGASMDEARATARYVCASDQCGGACYAWHKSEMLNKGVWVPQADEEGKGGRTVEDVLEHGEGSIAGTGKGNLTGIERSHVSFQLGSQYSLFGGATWGEMAAAFVKDVQAHGGITRTFTCGWLGEPWREGGEGMKLGELARLCVPASDDGLGGYRLGECPRGVLAIVRAIDVQKDGVWVVDRGFGERGRDTWLVNFMRVPRQVGMNLAEVWPMLRPAYRQLGTGLEIKVQAEFIDSGFFTDEVYKAVIARRGMGIRAFPVKGKLRSGAMAAPWTLGVIDKLPDGTPVKGLPRLLVINSDYMKTAVTGRVRGVIEAPIDDEADVADDDRETAPGFYLPELDQGGRMRQYLEQVTSEHRVEDRGRDGRKHPQWVWKLRPGKTQNHAFDCECYALCGAEFLGVRKLGAGVKRVGVKEAGGGGDRGDRGGGMKGWVGSVKR